MRLSELLNQIERRRGKKLIFIIRKIVNLQLLTYYFSAFSQPEDLTLKFKIEEDATEEYIYIAPENMEVNNETITLSSDVLEDSSVQLHDSFNANEDKQTDDVTFFLLICQTIQSIIFIRMINQKKVKALQLHHWRALIVLPKAITKICNFKLIFL